MPKNTTKKELRKQILEQRSLLSDEYWRQASNDITHKTLNLSELNKASVIHCYISMNDRKEVDTHNLIDTLLDLGKTIVAPVSDFKQRTMRHYRLNSLDEIETNKWGIPEPRQQQEVSIDELEMILVPMAAGDLNKNRIGYGKGFYDRFLKRTDAVKAGLCFAFGIVEKIPVQQYDVPLDMIITEKEIIT